MPRIAVVCPAVIILSVATSLSRACKNFDCALFKSRLEKGFFVSVSTSSVPTTCLKFFVGISYLCKFFGYGQRFTVNVGRGLKSKYGIVGCAYSSVASRGATVPVDIYNFALNYVKVLFGNFNNLIFRTCRSSRSRISYEIK